jgi:DNA-directed RNA polymerase specialized sigma24 family protein
MAKSFYLSHAKQLLEDEMAHRQRELVPILTGRLPNAITRREVLENEIADRKLALEKLNNQTWCDRCENRVSDPETLRVRITKYQSVLANARVEKAAVRIECEDCCRPATTHEIQRAIESLQNTESRKLKKYACARARHFPPHLRESGEDLFQEAFYRTWAGRKKWKLAAVDFPGHVRFAIRNIAYDWKGQFYKSQFALESDNVSYTADGEEISLTENAASLEPSIEQTLIAREEIQHLLASFKNDKAAFSVLVALCRGADTAGDIIEETGLTKRQFERTRKRIQSSRGGVLRKRFRARMRSASSIAIDTRRT